MRAIAPDLNGAYLCWGHGMVAASVGYMIRTVGIVTERWQFCSICLDPDRRECLLEPGMAALSRGVNR